MLWPRRSFRRSARYFLKRALRVQASPHAIAAGVAIGVFCTFTPFVGLHFLLAIMLAWLVRVSVVAAATGTALGNPITIPFIWGGTLEVGRLILKQDRNHELRPEDLGRQLMQLEFEGLWEPLLKPMLLGSLLLGGLAAVISYFGVLAAARSFNEQRRRRLAERAGLRTQQVKVTVG